MAVDLYIYYRVRETAADVFASKALAMQDAIAISYRITPQLKRRPKAKDGLHTWMEVYPSVAADFETNVDCAVTEHDLASFIEGSRHVEYFVDASPCA